MIGASKLDKDKVDVIKKLLQEGDYTHKQIGDLFGVSREMISLINTGKRWNFNERSFVMKEDLEGLDDNTPKSNDYREFSNPYQPKGRMMTEFEIEYITTKIRRMIENNGKELSELTSITLEFEQKNK